MNKLDFFCVGAQKAGTTLLHDILIQHPEIYLPEEKEAHFFDVNELYERGVEYFKTFFKSYSNEKIIGNINPNLQIEDRSLQRIIDCYGNKEVKIIFLLRDPVKRAYSHYLMSKKRGYENQSFLKAIEMESYRLKHPKTHKDYESNELGHFEKNHLGYISRSLYSTKIKLIKSLFPDEHIKIVFFEKFINEKDKTISEILDFLGLDNTTELNTNIKSNPAQKANFFYLSKFLNTSSSLKDILKVVLPEFIRKPIKVFLNKKNMKTLSENEKNLSFSDYSSVNKYFVDDILELERLLEIKIDFWQY
ncbi:sulfotransferase family protein [Psychroserpens sp. MEBiC05023]